MMLPASLLLAEVNVQGSKSYIWHGMCCLAINCFPLELLSAILKHVSCCFFFLIYNA